MYTEYTCWSYNKSTLDTVYFDRNPFTCSCQGGNNNKKSINGFKFGTSVGSFSSHGAASMAAEGLIIISSDLLSQGADGVAAVVTESVLRGELHVVTVQCGHVLPQQANVPLVVRLWAPGRTKTRRTTG